MTTTRTPKLAEILKTIDPSRREFLTRLLATSALAAPAVASLSLPGAAYAQAASSSGGSYSTLRPTQQPTTAAPTQPPTQQVTTVMTTTQPHMTSGPRPTETTLYPTADTFIRQASPNTNEGANFWLRVSVQPTCRALVQFDRLALVDVLNQRPVRRALLVLQIAQNHNAWGQTRDYGVAAHALREEFVEGNGRQALLPRNQQQRGTGEGATWNSPADPNIYDDKAAPRSPKWNGGDFKRRESDYVTHENQQTGQIVFDVTQDILDGVHGWMLKISAEDDGCRGDWDDDHNHTGRGGQRKLGFEQFRGAVEYFSREGAAAAGDVNLGPVLVIS